MQHKSTNTAATTATTSSLLPELSITSAIQSQQAQSDTLSRLSATFILGRICSKTGALDETQLSQSDLSLLAIVADGTSFSTATYSLSAQLASHVSPAWVNTGPDQLNILRVADPHGFATFCIQQIYSRTTHDGDTPQSTTTYNGKYLRNVEICKLRDKLENEYNNPLVIAKINQKLTSLIACAKPRLLREAIQRTLSSVTTLSTCLANLPRFLNALQTIETKLINTLAKRGMTPTLLRSQREKNGGSSAMAASYSRDNTSSKQKWLRYISDYDNSFAAHIYDTLISSLTADELQMPRNNQAFTDVAISDTRLAAIKLQISKKRNTVVFDDILSSVDLSDLNNMDR